MINASIVLYNPNRAQVDKIVKTLLAAENVHQIYLIDNSPMRHSYDYGERVKYRFLGRNVGYGAGHNVALRESLEQSVDYHLVVNADIEFEPTILAELVHFMDTHPTVGHVMPKVLYPNGEIQYLCKQLPTPLDLFGRRFLPKKWMEKRNARFEMRETGYNHIMSVPYLSGCFMFLRVEALKTVGLFDERFFMYPEDIDLTRRIHEQYETLFYPNVTIIHNHAQASYKSLRMMWIHIVNICRYFNKWGWHSRL